MDLIKKIKHINRQRNYKTKKLKKEIKIKLLLLQMKRKNEQFSPEKVHDILFILTGIGIGDVIFLSDVFRELHNHGYNVRILINNRVFFLFEGIEGVDEIIVIEGKSDFNKLKSIKTDLIIDLYSRLEYLTYSYIKTISLISHKFCIGFNSAYKKPYDIVFSVNEKHAHITHAYQKMLELLGIQKSSLQYHLNIPASFIEETEKYLKKFPEKKIIALNPFASCTRRSLTIKQTNELLKLCENIDNAHIIIIGEQEKIIKIKKSLNSNICSFSSFWNAASIVKLSDLVVSVDTSIVHIASAFNKPLVSIYSSEVINGFQGDQFYAPNHENSIQLIAPDEAAKNIDTVFVYKNILSKI
ncbi:MULTISPECIES: glycosyltransferase family 9 protein [unclassified Brenneria]|uniref:glycosyltransferase family 9 protein n=1 Tax=unclassified Brenneria TaxID=2634434 RepID=UPI0029C1137E|nr:MULTISPECIES: glycosyltransferase family 9 protein [unclassified Brenneria]MDX5629727.1 glycosyltransferase family 9 protein [Brenneria sp. L3-3Z]MDX5696873.1 glycosyltransferase family 9 protein [Brenneria sp. L4-2C]